MMPGGIPLMPHMMGHPRPLFPAAAVSTAMGQPKPTFPAYSNATISAPPTTNLGNSSSSNSNTNDTQKPPAIPQNTGTATKIIHPPDDLSLEEIKARRPQYRVNKNVGMSQSQYSAAAIATSIAATVKANEAKMVSAAHEVSHIS